VCRPIFSSRDTASAIYISCGQCQCMRKGLSISMMTMVQVGPVLEAMEDILAALLRSLDGRVYVAVGRGLWDFTSKDIYDYVDSLQEGKENKVGASACQSLCGLPHQPS